MERRKTPRTSIPKLAYLNFEPYNTGGVITDLSTSGLRFHTVAPMQQGGVVRLSLTLGAMKPIEAIGELVWTDSTRQIGGVRFVVLPPVAAGQIKNWLQLSASSDAGENDAKSDAEAAEAITPLSSNSLAELDKLQASAPTGIDANRDAPKPPLPTLVPPQNAPLPFPGGDPNVRSPWVPPSARPYSAAASIGPHSSDAAKGDAAKGDNPSADTQPPYGFVFPGTPSTMPWITHFDSDQPAGKSAFARGVIAVLIVCVLLAPIAWIALHRYGVLSGPLWPVNSVASNPTSAQPDAAATPVSPAPDVASPPDGNSTASNPVDTQSATAATPVSAEPSPSAQALSSAPAPKPAAVPAANSIAQSAETKQLSGPQPAAPDSDEQPQASPAQSPIARTSPREITPPDSLALASEHVAKTPGPAPATEPENPGESQLILAWQYLEGQGGKPRDPTAASQLLWSAVQKGNLTAETTLANLYLRGEGVPKSCDQARVLLSAASDKGDAEAKRKLAELNQSGCR